MKKVSSFVFFVAILVVISLSNSFAHANFKNMILAGDSWGRYMCKGFAFERAFDAHKIYDARLMDCDNTTKNGALASTWLERTASKYVEAQIKYADVIYLSIGGNDFLHAWNKNMNVEQEAELTNRIVQDVKTILDHYVNLNSEIKIILSGYDFPNFETATRISPIEKLYVHLGEPTPEELNRGILRLSEPLSRLANNRNIFYIHHYGLMHYHYGNERHGLEEYVTLPPEDISPAHNPMAFGGDIRFEIPRSATYSIPFVYYDAFHLSPRGYQYVADHALQIYLKDILYAH